MEGYTAALLAALWLGVLTSVSPCPLATNVAAVGFIARHIESVPRVLLSGFLYTLGRLSAYVALGAALTLGLTSRLALSEFLQNRMNEFLGPLLILGGMLVLGLIDIPFPALKAKVKEDKITPLGSWVLGVLFALSFCPVSAAFFFASLVPLAVKYREPWFLPAVYGVGTALPVFVFAVAAAIGAGATARMFAAVTSFSKWAKVVTGVLLIGVGVYYCLAYVFELF